MRQYITRLVLLATLALGIGLAVAWGAREAASVSSTSQLATAGESTAEPTEVTEPYPVDLDLPVPPKTGNRKLQTPLDRLSTAMHAYGPVGAEVAARSMALTLDHGAVRVIANAQPGRAGEVSQRASSLGIPAEATYRDLVQLLVPVALLEELAQDPDVAFVRLPVLFVPSGAVTGEGVSLIGADNWHAAGSTGAGTKVGVLDLGFDGYQALLGTELPSSVVTESCQASGDITGDGEPHGTAVAEIVHEVAPDAQLYLANGQTEVEFANCVDWLKGQGVDIVNFSAGCSVCAPGDGTGTMNDIVNSAKAQGILWVNAAGNEAQQHWMGPWEDPDADNVLNFTADDETNAIAGLAGLEIVVAVKWDDPFGGSCNDYDLKLLDPTLTTIVARSENFQDCSAGSFPVEGFAYEVPADGVYHVIVTRYDADGLANFHLYSSGGQQCPGSLQHCVKSGSLSIPGDNPNALTVGAVPWDDHGNIEPFSSRGPTDDGRIKPDLVAPDGVSNASLNPFFGTSASSPHTAGAAALVKQWQPGWRQDEIRTFLMARAIDLGAQGSDNTFGEGRLDLGDPKTSATATATPSATPTSTPIAAPTATATNTPPPAATATPTNTRTPRPTSTPTPTPTPRPGMLGDVNCDGNVNSLDALFVLQYNAGLIDSLSCPDAADVNQNGAVNAIDATLILQYDAGMIGSLPP